MKVQELVVLNLDLVESHDLLIFEILTLFQFGLLVLVHVDLQKAIALLNLRQQKKIKLLRNESFGYPVYSLWEVYSHHMVWLGSIDYYLVILETVESDVWPVETQALGLLFTEFL